MTTAAWAFLALAAVLALCDWVARARPAPVGSIAPLELIGKPGAMVALLGVALTLDPVHTDIRAWFVVALVLSLAGDVFLILPSDRFLAGLASFLLAHIAYVVGLNLHSEGRWWVALPFVLVIVPVAVRLVRAVRAGPEPDFAVPVTLYVVVIATMGVSALASGNGVAAVGAILFVVSDALIGETRFVRPAPWASLAIMVTYHLGQAGLVLSLLRS